MAIIKNDGIFTWSSALPQSRGRDFSPCCISVSLCKGKANICVSINEELSQQLRLQDKDPVDVGFDRSTQRMAIRAADRSYIHIFSNGKTRKAIRFQVRPQWAITAKEPYRQSKCNVEIARPGFLQVQLPPSFPFAEPHA